MTGVERIAAERQRQLAVEGWDAAHDRGHGEELARAGATYALPPAIREQGVLGANLRRSLWPWMQQWWKPTPDDRIRELEKAGALIAAAIDALAEAHR